MIVASYLNSLLRTGFSRNGWIRRKKRTLSFEIADQDGLLFANVHCLAIITFANREFHSVRNVIKNFLHEWYMLR